MYDDILIKGGETAECRICIAESLEKAAVMAAAEAPVYLLYDRKVEKMAGELRKFLSPVAVMGTDIGEKEKTMESVLSVASWLLEKGADRNAVLVVAGGGVLTDTAGFAAAIYKRGIRTVYLPTTLLAQADACLGGKTGVNFAGYKNILGVIRQPLRTVICTDFLETLPYDDILSGEAEMLKTFIVGDAESYRKAVLLFSEMHGSPDKSGFVREHAGQLRSLIRAALSVKASIVSSDPFENGERRKLNLGHTFAHAIESRSGNGIPHGHAVSIGIVCSARLSEVLGLCRKGFADKISGDFLSCGLPVSLPFGPEELADAMCADKKAENGKVHFVTINDTGFVIISDISVKDAVTSLASY